MKNSWQSVIGQFAILCLPLIISCGLYLSWRDTAAASEKNQLLCGSIMTPVAVGQCEAETSANRRSRN